MPLSSTDPATGKLLRHYNEHTDTEVEARLQQASAAFEAHRRTSFAQRAAWMERTAELLEKEKEALGTIATQEMGKPLKGAIAEVEKCAWVCRYYSENAERFLADEPLGADAQQSFLRALPIGPVLAVMPWNFPYWQVFRFAAPALMAGNVGLLKHASNVTGCALAMEDIFLRAGFPKGVFQALLVGSARVARVLEDPRVMAATLTGSEGAGRSVASIAGQKLKKTVLELGGSDPFIVLPSADVALAAKTAVTSRTLNGGQSCISAKRFIVHTRVYDAFEQAFVEGMRKLRLGDPLLPETDVGPLATPAIRDEVAQLVDDALAQGAKALLGGTRPSGTGSFYPPTVLVNVSTQARAYHEEIFGPVATLFRVDSAEEALRIANDTRFGLASSVWTQDSGEMALFCDGLEAGQTFFNALVASDPRLPFGGVKQSGYGRELSREGIREFVNLKTVVVQGMSGNARLARRGP